MLDIDNVHEFIWFMSIFRPPILMEYWDCGYLLLQPQNKIDVLYVTFPIA